MSEQLTQLEFANLVRDIFDACARRDYAWAIQHFAEDVNYADPTRYVNCNRAELLHFFEDDGGFEQCTVWHNVVFDEKRQIGAVEWTYDGTHRYHGASWVKAKNRQITHWREYQHVDDREWAEFFGGAASESMIM